MKAIYIFFYLTGYAVFVNAQTSPVELFLSSPSSVYKIGEDIPITLSIRSKHPSANLEFRQDVIQNMTANFIITDPEGNTLQRLSEDAHYKIPAEDAPWIALKDNGTIIKTINITDVYTEPYDIDIPHTISKPGQYRILYKASVAIRADNNPVTLWQGPIQTAPINITIREVDEASLREARQILSGKNQNGKKEELQALNRMRYSTSQMPPSDYELLQAVLDKSDQEVKMYVFRILGAKHNDQSFGVILHALRSETNPYVRAEAIGALRHFKSPAALHLVMDECKTRRERSYRAAIVVLGSIGDKTAIPILQEIADTDDTEWVRVRAMDIIKQIIARAE